MFDPKIRKILFTLVILVVVIGIAVAAFNQTNKNSKNSDNSKIKVAASFYPLYEFTKQVGGDRVEVTNITPAGVEPHEYEPTSANITNILGSKLFVYQGGDFDPWSSKIAKQAEAEKVRTLDAITGISLISEDAINDSGEISSVPNPHTWLDPILAIAEVKSIRDNLIAIDPGSQSTYQQNADNYITQLKTLDSNYIQGLAQCRQSRIIVTHDAYVYFAKRYNFQTLPIAGLEPSDEPTPSELASLITTAKESGLKYVFFESQVSPKYAETVAREVGAKTLTLNTLESPTTTELSSGMNYITGMNDNLNNLKIAMECGN